MISCNDEPSPDTLVKESASSRNDDGSSFPELDNLDPPVLFDDVYSFRDTAHFASFYNQALDLMVYDNQAFYSLREYFNDVPTVLNLLIDDSFASFDEAYKPHLTDPVLQLICNEHYEIKIDDVLITHVNDEEVIKSEYADSGVRNVIRQLKKGDEISTDDLPYNALLGSDLDMKSYVAGPFCDCDFSVKRISCDEWQISGQCQDLLWGESGADIKIWLLEDSDESRTGQPDYTFDVGTSFKFTFEVDFMDDEGLFFLEIDPDCGPAPNIYGLYPHDKTWCFDGEALSRDMEVDDTWDQGLRVRSAFVTNVFASYAFVEGISMWRDGPNSNWITHSEADMDANIFHQPLKAEECTDLDWERNETTCQDCPVINATSTLLKHWLIGNDDRVAHCDYRLDLNGTVKKHMGPWGPNNDTWSISANAAPNWPLCCNL